MKTLLLVVFPFFYFVNAQGLNCIIWDKEEKLKKEDFTIVDFDSLLVNGNPFGANSVISIEFDEQTNKFVAKFWKNESILSNYFDDVEPTSLISILNHEQGHFDIAQIFALKMNLMYFENRFSKSNNQLQEIYNICYERYSKVQEKYDKETNHNKNREKQLYWDNSIQGELQKLNEAIERIEKIKKK